jgi:RimJ/RimL family protein N-acetyltransferase
VSAIDERRTTRLRLRRIVDADRVPFAAMSADPEVMRFFPSTLLATEANDLLNRLEDHWRREGFGFWAVDDDSGFVGLVGLLRVGFAAPFVDAAAPPVEVGWRLARHAWGRGYAVEAAREAVAVAFDVIGVDEVVSFTVPANQRSRRVMERLGMTHDPAGAFEHPRLPEGHPLRPHVLYRLPRTSSRVL